jgi:putative Mn2+ efflux pump MntP
LIYGVVVAYFGQQLRAQLGVWLPRLETFSAVLLIAVGLNQLLRLL